MSGSARATSLVALATTLGLLAALGCAQDVNRPKEITERSLGDLANFDVVDLHGPFHADVLVGRGPSVALEGPQHLIDAIESSVANGRLSLELDVDHDDGDFVTARIEAPALRALDIAGAGRVTVKEPRGEELRITVSGASDLTVTDVELKVLHLIVNGAAQALLVGTASEAHFSLNGAGSIRAQDLVTEVTHIDLTGAGSARVHATSKVAGSISGVGKLSVAGSPTERAVTSSGVSDVVYED